jgi:hypothetical protein
MQQTQKIYRYLALLLLLLLVAISYRQAPNNVFHFDDESNIIRYPPVLMTELSIENLVDAGRNAYLPTRPLPSVTFAFDWWRGGGLARPFQYTNLVIHGASALAVYWLLLLVLSRLRQPSWTAAAGAFVGAALWACHPIQVQGVTYIVQRMTSMAALFTILSVIFYVLGRESERVRRRWGLLVLATFCWALGMISKETAAIAPFLVLLAEYGVLRQGQPLIRSKLDWTMLSLPVVVGVLIVIDIASGVGPLSDTFLPGYGGRDFSLSERLLTQPRIIVFHFSQILWPLPGRFSLEHDFALSTGLLNPVSTLFASFYGFRRRLSSNQRLFRSKWYSSIACTCPALPWQVLRRWVWRRFCHTRSSYDLLFWRPARSLFAC